MAVDGLSPQEGYINNVISMETERGTSSCPWLIRGLPGQIINITLINFATVSLHNEERVGGSEPRMCYHMASIRDGSGKPAHSALSHLTVEFNYTNDLVYNALIKLNHANESGDD